MGWAERKVEEYNQGKSATWIERRCLEHANPVHLLLALVSVIPFIWGLWAHNWTLLTVAIILNLVGHMYCWVRD